MVVRIFFSLLLIVFLFLNIPVYGLQPYSAEEADLEEARQEALKIKEEKSVLMQKALPLREEQNKKLHPFVNADSYKDEVVMPGKTLTKTMSFAPPEKPASKKPLSSPLFFFFITLAFLASYLLIRPRD